MEGYIRSYRKMFDNPVVTKDAEHLAVWVYLLHYATHTGYDIMFGGKRITLKPGQLPTSRASIARKLSISESKVQRILKTFEIEQQIEQQVDSRSRLITLINWDRYQKSEQQIEQQVNSNRTASEQQVNTHNNDNNDNNDLKMNNNYSEPPVKKEKTIPEKNIIPPTLEMVKAYCEKRNNGIDAGYFIDYYSARGWYLNNKKKMVDWHSAVGTWERNKKKYDGVSEDQNKESEVTAQYKDSEYYEQISLLMEGRE